ncbi:Uncharacterised protein [Bordetella pertussis]|nr:Uncharacterised protein [Bordetella pertussis]
MASDAAPSTMAASMTWPRPERLRSSKAATTPSARYSAPPAMSPVKASGIDGGWPARPMAWMMPVSAT